MRREIEYIDPEGLDLTDNVVQINRTAKVMKGGRRFGFSALVVVGDGRGIVGLGFGKAREVPPSVEKGVTDARKKLLRVPLKGTTVPHATIAAFRSSRVKLMPAAPGTDMSGTGDSAPSTPKSFCAPLHANRNPTTIRMAA